MTKGLRGSGCVPVPGESPRDPGRRAAAAEAAEALAAALRAGDLDLAARLLRELCSDMDRLGIGPAS